MKLHQHTAYSVIIGGILFMIFKSWAMSLACILSGIFIDLDHIIDVVREHGWHVGVKRFFYICENAQFNRIILILHGWEWLPVWAVAAWLTGWNPWITGMLLGLSQHMILDASSNSSNFSSYSLIWRCKNDFHFD
ncbi:MAG: hypothetical protein AB1499_14885, partial [Nitrospirota bacterium]